jgi:pimeloyl-ACP methyl ester carboxylesterase
MFPDFLPSNVNQLTEETSIAIAQQIQLTPLTTNLTPEPIPTAYLQAGVGHPPVLLLHGFDSSLFEFRRLLPRLTPQHQTWAVDLLGFGFTERLSTIKFNPDNIKAHLHRFWETLIQEPVVLVGASMGGAVALDFTLTYPESVSKLVLLDSAGIAKNPAIGKFMIPPIGFLATEFLRNLRVRKSISQTAYYDKSFANPDALTCAALHLAAANWNQALIGFTKSGGYGSFAERLSAIQQPTLIIWGENDKILGTKDAAVFAEAIPHSKLVWITECGHVPHLEKSQQTAQAILNFI